MKLKDMLVISDKRLLIIKIEIVKKNPKIKVVLPFIIK
jgi:hypothetical protein